MIRQLAVTKANFSFLACTFDGCDVLLRSAKQLESHKAIHGGNVFEGHSEWLNLKILQYRRLPTVRMPR